MFAPVHVLRNRREQRPSKKGDLDSSVTREVEDLLHGGGLAPGFIFVQQNATVVGLRFKWYSLYISNNLMLIL
jgi:hypothetical protein